MKGRDVPASVGWILSCRKEPILQTFPRDVVRLILSWLVFPVYECACGRLFRPKGLFSRKCSMSCVVACNRLDTYNKRREPQKPYKYKIRRGREEIGCSLCKKPDRNLWIVNFGSMGLCENCFQKFRRNKFCLEK